MSDPKEIRVACRVNDDGTRSTPLLRLLDMDNGLYAVGVGIGGRSRYFSGRNAFALGMRAFEAKRSAMGLTVIRNAVGEVAV